MTPREKIRLFRILLLIALIGLAASSNAQSTLTTDNGQITVKLDLTRGGSICWVSLSGSATNLVNTADEGRYVQQSYYAGRSLNRQSEGQSAMWSPWPWNPIQAGDYTGNRAQILVASKDGLSLYIKCIPMLWDMANKPAEAEMEQWTTPIGNAVKVHNRLTCHRTDSIYGENIANPQELPAVYPISQLKYLCAYLRNAPFTHDQLDLPTVVNLYQTGNWGSYNTVTEHWMAFVNANGFGMGVYNEKCNSFGAGIAGNPGGDSSSGDTCYITPSAVAVLNKNTVYEFDYYLVIGTTNEIRDTVYQIHSGQFPGTLFVTDGTGSGAYTNGEVVSITANAAPTGKVFCEWTSDTTVSFSNAFAATTTFTMPATNVVVSASYTIPGAVRVRDSSFESPATINRSEIDAPPGTGWTFTAGGIAANGSDLGNPNAPEGRQTAFLRRGGRISTTLVDLAPGASNQVIFSAAQSPGCPAQTFHVALDGISLGAFTAPASGQAFVDFITAPFTTAGGPHELSFIRDDFAGGNATLFIDNICVVDGLPKPRAAVSGGNLVLSWQLAVANYFVYSTTNLAPPVAWTLEAPSLATNGLQILAAFPARAVNKFFRLERAQSPLPGTLFYNFDDGTMQGWKTLSSSKAADNYYDLAFAPVRVEHDWDTSLNNPGLGAFFLGETPWTNDSRTMTWANWPAKNSGVHQTLWVESPPFLLNGSGDLTFLATGSEGAINPATGLRDIPLTTIPAVAGTWGSESGNNPSTSGMCAVGLRRDDGTFVLTRHVLGWGSFWTTYSFSRAELQPFVNDGHSYTLDLVDALAGTGAWIAIDDIRVPGVALN